MNGLRFSETEGKELSQKDEANAFGSGIMKDTKAFSENETGDEVNDIPKDLNDDFLENAVAQAAEEVQPMKLIEPSLL